MLESAGTLRTLPGNIRVERRTPSRYKQDMRFPRSLPSVTLIVISVLAPARAALIAEHPAAGAARAEIAMAPEVSLDLNGYRAELSRWSALVGRLKEHPDEAATLRRQLPGRWKVTVRNQSYEVPTRWLRNALSTLETHPQFGADDSKQIQARLELMQTDAVAMSDEAGFQPHEARRRLERILRQGEFAAIHGPTALEHLRARISRWLDDHLVRLLGRMGNHPLVMRGLVWVLAIGLTLFFFALLAHAFLDRHPEPALDLRGFLAVPRGWRDWAREARQASERNDYREAIHLAYWAGIYHLEEIGLWQVDHTRTHREYLRLLPRNPENELQRDSLAALTSRFERVWYGGQRASAPDYATVISDLETLGCRFQ